MGFGSILFLDKPIWIYILYIYGFITFMPIFQRRPMYFIQVFLDQVENSIWIPAFLLSLLFSFFAFLLLCFSVFRLFCFASLLFCFSGFFLFLLFCFFLLFCCSCFSLFCFSALSAFCFSCFCASVPFYVCLFFSFPYSLLFVS